MTATIEQYLRIRQAFNPTFVGDGSRLAFLMNLTGTAQVYSMDYHGGWPKLLTEFDNRVMALSGVVGRDLVLLATDQGGNENQQLYSVNPDGTDLMRITDNPRAMYDLGPISADGRQVAVATNQRNGTDFDLYILTIGETFDQARLVSEREGWWRAVDFSQDGRRILVTHHVSNVNHDLYEIDVERGALTHLTPHQGDAQYGFARYWQNGVLTLTDQDREFSGIAYIENGGLDWVSRYDYDVDLLVTNRERDGYAFVTNQDGYSRLYFSGGTHHATPAPVLDHGVIAGMEFSPDGRYLAVTYHSAAANPNIYLVNVATFDCRPVTSAPTGGLDLKQFVEPELHHFPSFDGRQIPVWLYRPHSQSTKSCPVVLSVHGGPEAQELPGFNAVYQYLLAAGFAIAAPNVRGSSGYGKTYVHLDDKRLRMDSVKDLASLVHWIERQDALDARRVALMGGSYGGFMVLAGLTTFPDLFAAGVDTVGIANFETFLENTGPYRRKLREPEYGTLEEDREFFREISPIHHVDRIQAPLMVIHGKNDPRVPVGEAEQIVRELQERKRPVEYLLFDDEGHGVVKLKNRLQLYPEVVRFLSSHLQTGG